MKLTPKCLAAMAMLWAMALGIEVFGQSQPAVPRPQSATSHKKRGQKPPVTPPIAVPAATPPEAQAPPLRPSQMPAVPPRVSYSNGQLTVVAENSTLGDVLNAIHNTTGMQIETTGANATDRVAAKIGPGSVLEVLLAVLQGSRYDYILLGAANNPDQIERVILTPKTGGASTAEAQGNASVVGSAPPRPATAVTDDSDEDSDSSNAPAPQQVPLTPNARAPASPVQNVKTPEQLLEDLRRMEQQRRKQNPPELPDNRPRIERPPE